MSQTQSEEEIMTKTISITGVLAMLEDGKNRDEIALELGLSGVDKKHLFAHPALKNRRARKKPSITIIDDRPEAQAPAPTQITEAITNANEAEAAGRVVLDNTVLVDLLAEDQTAQAEPVVEVPEPIPSPTVEVAVVPEPVSGGTANGSLGGVPNGSDFLDNLMNENLPTQESQEYDAAIQATTPAPTPTPEQNSAESDIVSSWDN